MWSETIGLRTKRTKKIGLGFGLARCGLGLGGPVLCFETRSCYDCRHNDLEGHSNFSSTIFLFFLFCAWNITTYCNTASATLFAICSLGLGLVILILVL